MKLSEVKEKAYADISEMEKSFHDSPEWISGWLHDYVCPDCSLMLEFHDDLSEYHADRFSCPHCGKIVSGEKYQQAWLYLYRQKHAEQIIEAVLLKDDQKVLDQLIAYVDFYAINYESFPEHGVRVGKGKIMAQSLDEAVFGIHLLRVIHYADDGLPENKKKSWYEKLFRPMAEFLLPQSKRIHNISFWIRCFVAMAGAVFNDQDLIDKALLGEYGVFQQLKTGLTEDSLWREGSLHYHYYSLEALTYLCEVYKQRDLWQYMVDMYRSPLRLSFDEYHLPSLNDGWYPLDLSKYGKQIAIAAALTSDPDLMKQVERIGNYDPEALESAAVSVVPTTSSDMRFDHIYFGEICFDQRAAINRNEVPIILKSGSIVGTHMRRDALSISIDHFSDDLGTPGYGSPINADWYRSSLSHNTVSIDGSQPGGLYNNKVYKTNKGYLAEILEAQKNGIIKAQRSLEEVDGYIADRTEIATSGCHCFDWAFHCKGDLNMMYKTSEAHLGEEGAYKFFENVRRIKEKKDLKFVFSDENNGILSLRIPFSEDQEVYIAETPGQPADCKQNSIIIRKGGDHAVFDVSWQLTNKENNGQIKRRIPLCCITDHNYVLPTLVMLQSLKTNQSDDVEYQIYIVIPQDLPDSDRESLESIPLNIKLVKKTEAEVYQQIPMGKRHVTLTALLKFDLAEMFPQIDKLLYLDTDILILKDLQELYDTELGDSYAAVVESFSARFTTTVHFEHNFNSGMMLLNTKKMREDSISQKLIDYRLNGDNHFMDQDAFNAIFEGHIVFLPITYNLMYTSIYRFSAPEICRKYGIPAAADWDELCDRSTILHFSSAEKPWKYQNIWQHEHWKAYYNRLPQAIRDQYPLEATEHPSPKRAIGLRVSGQIDETKPLVSIIVPVKDCGQYLSSCLDSILLQTYRNYEVICVDGGSIDNSLQILKEYERADWRIKLCQISCGSAGAARNHALKEANGKYVLFIDGDDRVEPELLEKTVAKADAVDADLVCFPAKNYDSNNLRMLNQDLYLNKKLLEKCNDPFSAEDVPDDLFQITSAYVFNRIYNLEFIKRNELRMTDCLCFDDLSFSCLSMLKAKKISWITDALYIHTMRNGKSIYKGRYADAFYDEVEKVYSQLPENMCSSFYIFVLNQLYPILRNSYDPDERLAYLNGINNREWLKDYLQSDEIPQSVSDIAQIVLGALEQLSETTKAEGTAALCRQNSVADPLVSVIMPVYQAEEYLNVSLNSVLCQTFDRIEVLCIDDGSKDDSLKILLEMAEKDSRISVYSQQHEGVGTARNVGIENARGRYLYFMDSDDVLNEKALELLIEKAEKDKLDVVYFNADVSYDPGCGEEELSFRPNYIRKYDYSGILSGPEIFEKFIKNNEYIVTIWIAFYRRSMIEDGNIHFLPGVVHNDNQFTFQTMLEAKRAAYIPNVLYTRLIHPDSIMTSKKNFHSCYSYFVLYNYMNELKEKYLHDAQQSASSSISHRVALMLRSARYEYRKLDDFEKGRFMALGNDYTDFRINVIDPCEYQTNQSNTAERNRVLQNELSAAKEKRLSDLEESQKKQNDLTNQIEMQKIEYEKSIKDLETELEKQNEEASVLKERLEKENQEKSDLNRSLLEKTDELEKTNNAYQKTIIEKQQLDSSLVEAKTEIEKKNKQIAELKKKEQALKKIKESKTYRVATFLVRPIRKIKRIIKKAFRVLKRK